MKYSITYHKHFRSGRLAGQVVECGFTFDSGPLFAAARLERMKSFTQDAPGTDYLTKAKWFTSHVVMVEVPSGKRVNY